jgi:hypothetical protein
MTGAGRRCPCRLHNTVQSLPSIQDRFVVGIETGATDDLLAVGYFDLRGKPSRQKRAAPAVACFISLRYHATPKTRYLKVQTFFTDDGVSFVAGGAGGNHGGAMGMANLWTPCRSVIGCSMTQHVLNVRYRAILIPMPTNRKQPWKYFRPATGIVETGVRVPVAVGAMNSPWAISEVMPEDGVRSVVRCRWNHGQRRSGEEDRPETIPDRQSMYIYSNGAVGAVDGVGGLIFGECIPVSVVGVIC